MARILIVDDNLLIRTLLREILTSGGHEVVGEAENGMQAPSCLYEAHPDLVTLDLVMPGRSGLTTLNHLLMINPALVVIVCSASLDQHKVIRALQLGAKGFIVKPFTRETVLDAVRDSLGHSHGPPPAVELSASPNSSVNGTVEQREFERVKGSLPVAVVSDDRAPLDTFTADLSGSGMLLASGSLTAGARVRFRLQLGPGR